VVLGVCGGVWGCVVGGGGWVWGVGGCVWLMAKASRQGLKKSKVSGADRDQNLQPHGERELKEKRLPGEGEGVVYVEISIVLEGTKKKKKVGFASSERNPRKDYKKNHLGGTRRKKWVRRNGGWTRGKEKLGTDLGRHEKISLEEKRGGKTANSPGGK